MGKHPKWAAALFSPEDLDAIGRAVGVVEAATSAELRVHLERHAPAGTEAMARALDVFAALGMHRTAGRNAVLIYLAVEDHKLAVVGDEGIHAKVGPQYWEHVRDLMLERLRSGAARDAVLAAVEDVGAVLRRYFPQRPDDTNELSNEVSLQ
ncbi:MAG TPA: TPM domain-containing protein [Candidatus Limnocylindria bacterium]|nr:TPM domain-containing protein [Candidatus Limnocylindria bacterium]